MITALLLILAVESTTIFFQYKESQDKQHQIEQCQQHKRDKYGK